MEQLTLNDLQEDFLYNSVRRSDIEAYRRMYGEGPDTSVQSLELSDNDLVLGCRTAEFSRENLVFINLRKVGKGALRERYNSTLLLCGAPGSGKSTDARTIAIDNFYQRFGEALFVVDPKHEWTSSKEPFLFDNSRIAKRVDSFIRTIGLQRRGYDMVSICPYILDPARRTGADINFAIGFQHIQWLIAHNPDDAIQLFMELVGISSTTDLVGLSPSELLQEEMVRPSVTSYEILIEKLKKLGNRQDRSYITDNMIAKIQSALRRKVISDKPEDQVNVLKLMSERKIVVFFSKLKGTSYSDIDRAFMATLKILVYEIGYDGLDFHLEHRKDAVIRTENGRMIWLSEQNGLLPATEQNSNNNIFWVNLYTKFRAAGLDIGGDVQNIDEVDEHAFPFIKIILTSKPTEANAKMLKSAKHMSDAEINILRDNLRSKVATSIGTEPTEKAYIDEEGYTGVYIPLPPMSSIPHR